MKKLLLLLPAALIFHVADAQILKKITDKAKQKIDQRINEKLDRTMDKGLDQVEGKGSVKSDDGGSEQSGNSAIQTKNSSRPETLQAYSKYDFVQGEKVVAFEDFARTELGDFPTSWNTNATAEVVTLNNKEGKWLRINKEGVWFPEFITNLPENFTLEFDLGVSNDFDGSSFVLNVANLKNPAKEYKDLYHNMPWGRFGHTLQMQFSPSNGRINAWARLLASSDGNYDVNNTTEFKTWNNS